MRKAAAVTGLKDLEINIGGRPQESGPVATGTMDGSPGDPDTRIPVEVSSRSPASGSAARYFFHLCNGEQMLRDESGVELSAVDHLRDIFVQTAGEMQREAKLNLPELDGWQVLVADATGMIVQRFRLADLMG